MTDILRFWEDPSHGDDFPEPWVIRFKTELVKQHVEESLSCQDDIVDMYFFEYDREELDEKYMNAFVNHMHQGTGKDVIAYDKRVMYQNPDEALETLKEVADELGYELVEK